MFILKNNKKRTLHVLRKIKKDIRSAPPVWTYLDCLKYEAVYVKK